MQELKTASEGPKKLRPQPGLEGLQTVDRAGLYRDLNTSGAAIIPGVLTPAECEALISAYRDASGYRSTIDMQRFNFGRGQYRYFAYPLPTPVALLRRQLYQLLLPLARDWAQRLTGKQSYPDTHEEYIRLCHEHGQCRPTPLILRYGAGDYNCLHQDLYGDQFFPLQTIFMLSRPGIDYSGGELVLTEQRPRMQSRAQVFQPRQGDALVLAVNQRPVVGKRGDYRVQMRHGVSEITRGERYSLGVILHDAQ